MISHGSTNLAKSCTRGHSRRSQRQSVLIVALGSLQPSAYTVLRYQQLRMNERFDYVSCRDYSNNLAIVG